MSDPMRLHTHSQLEGMMKREIRRLARQGKLVDHCFKEFSHSVFPGATQAQTYVMRVCFFAGIAEMLAVMNMGLDPEIEEMEADLEFMSSWVQEVEQFHSRTYQAWGAQKGKHEN